MKIPFIRLDSDLPTPGHAHPGDAGVDLYARVGQLLAAGQRVMMPTGVAVAIPRGHCGLVTPRSGLAARYGLAVVNSPGIVDAGYRGELTVVLVNLGQEPYKVERGDRIAQLVVLPVVSQEFVEVEALPSSHRGSGGFGSTGS